MSDGRSIPASREDVLSMFATWGTDSALVKVELRFRVLAATFRARVTSASFDRLTLMSDDTRSELVLPIPPEMTFRFLDMRGSPHEQEFERMLVLFYRYKLDPDETDQIVLAEIKDGHNG